MNLPENPQQPEGAPVANTGATPASPFPAALATSAADALLLPTRVELCAHLSAGIRGLTASSLWHKFIARLDEAQPQPALN